MNFEKPHSNSQNEAGIEVAERAFDMIQSKETLRRFLENDQFSATEKLNPVRMLKQLEIFERELDEGIAGSRITSHLQKMSREEGFRDAVARVYGHEKLLPQEKDSNEDLFEKIAVNKRHLGLLAHLAYNRFNDREILGSPEAVGVMKEKFPTREEAEQEIKDNLISGLPEGKRTVYEERLVEFLDLMYS
jgi:hypothetical protein